MATFEELAEQLARGATSSHRIEAADALAGLDDPRVAPTLAKALADPHPAVREHVEELLAQFGHRDRTGHLRALLDEAERVSAALAAEVGRLRGDDLADDAPPTLEPIAPPEGFDGECVVVRLDAGPMDTKRVCQIVATALGEALFAVTREVHVTKGFLARSVPAEVARQLVRDLAAAGLPVAAAPVEWLPEPLDAVRLRRPEFGRAALRGAVVPDGHACEVAWDTVELVAAGRIEVELRRDRL